jgi:hypothetical protein
MVSAKFNFSYEEIQPGRGLPGGRAGEASVFFPACATICASLNAPCASPQRKELCSTPVQPL